MDKASEDTIVTQCKRFDFFFFFLTHFISCFQLYGMVISGNTFDIGIYTRLNYCLYIQAERSNKGYVNAYDID